MVKLAFGLGFRQDNAIIATVCTRRLRSFHLMNNRRRRQLRRVKVIRPFRFPHVSFVEAAARHDWGR